MSTGLRRHDTIALTVLKHLKRRGWGVKVLNRARMEGLRCWVECGKAVIRLTVYRAPYLKACFRRLLFRNLGRRWSARFKHLSIDSKQAVDAGHITTQVPLRGDAGIVKNFYGIVRAPPSR